MACHETHHFKPSIFTDVYADAVEILFVFLLITHLVLNLRVAITIIGYNPARVQQQIPISVIICAHNEHENLENLVPLILAQESVDFEAIVVLDRSTDGSEEFLNSIADHRLKTIVQDHLPADWDGKKLGLTKAIESSKNEWLLLTDADCVPTSSKWIKSFTELIDGNTALILGLSPYKIESGFLSRIIQYETFQTAIHYTSATLRGQAYMGVGRNIAYKKSSFHNAGGFSGIGHITGGDDDLLVQKIASNTNTRVNIGSESLTYSFPKRTWKEYLTQKSRHLSVGKFYRSKFKNEHTWRIIIHAGLWLSFLYLISFSSYPWRIIVPYGLLVLIKGLFFNKIASRTEMPLQMSWYPIMDLLYAVFLPLIAIRALLERNIRWKK